MHRLSGGMRYECSYVRGVHSTFILLFLGSEKPCSHFNDILELVVPHLAENNSLIVHVAQAFVDAYPGTHQTMTLSQKLVDNDFDPDKIRHCLADLLFFISRHQRVHENNGELIDHVLL